MNGPLSFVHPSDAARGFVEAHEAERSGVYHVVDDESIGIDTFLREFADRLDAPDPGLRIPRWLARYFLGDVTASLLAKPMPTSNHRFRAETGWEPQFSTVEAGIDHVVERWKQDGTVADGPDGLRWNGS